MHTLVRGGRGIPIYKPLESLSIASDVTGTGYFGTPIGAQRKNLLAARPLIVRGSHIELLTAPRSHERRGVDRVAPRAKACPGQNHVTRHGSAARAREKNLRGPRVIVGFPRDKCGRTILRQRCYMRNAEDAIMHAKYTERRRALCYRPGIVYTCLGYISGKQRAATRD